MTAARRLAVVAVVLLVLAGCEVRLGNDDATFGTELAGDLNGDGDGLDAGECTNPFAACAGGQPVLWAAINSPRYDNANGDPYTSRCLTGTACATPDNPEYRASGYRYAIEVAAAGQTVTVDLYDASVVSSGTATSDSGSFPVQFELFADDGDALAASTAPELSMAGQCSTGPGRRGFPGGYNPGGGRLQHRWWTLCTFTAPSAGTWVLQVKVDDLAADPTTGLEACGLCTATTSGLNAYAVRATAADGPAPEVAALGDMSVYTPTNGATVTHRLLEVAADRAGDQLVIDLYDIGDVSSTTATLELNGPGGLDVGCQVAIGAATGTRLDAPESTESYPSECRFVTAQSGVRFSSRWVRVTATVPGAYACTTDCWWSLKWSGTTTVTDRFTATAAISDAP